MALGGLDPLTRYTTDLNRSFGQIDDTIDAAVLAELDDIHVEGNRIVLSETTLKGPSSTWTYLVNDDPFRNQIGMMLTGPGKDDVRDWRGVDVDAAADFLGNRGQGVR